MYSRLPTCEQIFQETYSFLPWSISIVYMCTYAAKTCICYMCVNAACMYMYMYMYMYCALHYPNIHNCIQHLHIRQLWQSNSYGLYKALVLWIPPSSIAIYTSEFSNGLLDIRLAIYILVSESVCVWGGMCACVVFLYASVCRGVLWGVGDNVLYLWASSLRQDALYLLSYHNL